MIDLKVDILSENNEPLYEDFLKRTEHSLFYHTIKYRNFLRKILPSSKSIYIIAINSGKIVGALPLFISNLDNNSSVINSLPFYGSHGGILISNNINGGESIVELLLHELINIVKKEKCISFNIVDNPSSSMGAFYEKKFNLTPSDYRISQVTNLVTNNSSIENGLMEKFHSKTRNMVRKSLKYDFNVKIDNTYEGFKKIHHFHNDNMTAIGGAAKPIYVFNALHETFEPEKDYNIYIAQKNESFAAGLLVFYYENYCEYFTPVINNEYRNEQPLSLLIFTAMKDACKRGVKHWNWGGTWPENQDGVYFFKKRWGSDEKKYYYYTKIFDQEAVNKNIKSFKESCRYFYLKDFRNHNEHTV
jgi:hypothetical protein